MDYQEKPREQRLSNSKRKCFTITRGGAKRIALIDAINAKRYVLAMLAKEKDHA